MRSLRWYLERLDPKEAFARKGVPRLATCALVLRVRVQHRQVVRLQQSKLALRLIGLASVTTGNGGCDGGYSDDVMVT